MKPISIVISSLRPDRLEETLSNIESEREMVEVVVTSPIAPRARDFVKHVQVPASGDPRELTFTQKFNLAVAHSSGRYVVYDNDDLHFSPGWAAPLVRHMEGARWHPYLAAFPIATNGVIVPRHTIFGLLYANHGCISRDDLAAVGGLLDERLKMNYSDVDLALRVWARGGRVSICDAVVMHADRDVDHMAIALESVPLGTKRSLTPAKGVTYRDIWMRHDSRVFFNTWFRRYFGLFWKHYGHLRHQLASNDGVVPAGQQARGLASLMIWPALRTLLSPRLSITPGHRLDLVKTHCVRVVNRRWGGLSYELPYDPKEVAAR